MGLVKNLVLDHKEEIMEHCKFFEEKGLIREDYTYGIIYRAPKYYITICCERYSYDEVGIFIEYPTSYKNCPFGFELIRDYYRRCCEEEYWKNNRLVDLRNMSSLKRLFYYIGYLIDNFKLYTNKSYCERRQWDLVYQGDTYYQIVDMQAKENES